MEEFGATFHGGDVTVSARLLRRHLAAQQRAELAARLITGPWARSRDPAVAQKFA